MADALSEVEGRLYYSTRRGLRQGAGAYEGTPDNTAQHDSGICFLTSDDLPFQFVRPLYRQLYSWTETKGVARTTFQEMKDNYHPICRKMLAKDLEVEAAPSAASGQRRSSRPGR